MGTLLIDRTPTSTPHPPIGYQVDGDLTRRRLLGTLTAAVVLAGCAAPAPSTTPSAEPQTREITDAPWVP